MHNLRRTIINLTTMVAALAPHPLAVLRAQPGPAFPVSPSLQQQPFDWTAQRTSPADLIVPNAAEFRHGDASLTAVEKEVYRNLLDAAEQQYEQLWLDPDRYPSPRSAWETAFYQFEHVRRMAWENGNLKLTGPPAGRAARPHLADPFRDADAPVVPSVTADDRYQVLTDIQRHPQDFVGRPVVMIGRFEPVGTVDLTYEFGSPTAAASSTPLLRGVLTTMDGNKQLALVDAERVRTPESDVAGPDSWPAGATSLPVLVKGWVVKLWDTRPLVFCQSLRHLGAEPDADLIRLHSVPQRRVLPEENWLYYETLRQMHVADAADLRRLADETKSRRITELLSEVRQQAATELAALTQPAGGDREQTRIFAARKTHIQRLLDARVRRYQRCREDPDAFETFVDLFQHSDTWLGKLVTLKGHVRHAVSYPGDESLFGGRMLHELWLFTDDSQHNPAVILTPDLPPDFPIGVEVINRVTVTGCFFKRYVYGAQDSNRLAPLILAGHVRWEPTPGELRTLVDAGDLPAGTDLAQRALQQRPTSFSGPVLLMICFLAVLAVMVSMGRAQREKRDRRRLLHRISEDPEFETHELY